MTEYNCRAVNEHFKTYDYTFFTLNTSHELCRKCYDKLYHTAKSCDISNVLSDSSQLQKILNDHEHIFSEMKKMLIPNYKDLALEYTIIHVAKHLLQQTALILSKLHNYFCQYYDQLIFSATGRHCLLENISNSWLKLELSRHFSDHLSLSTMEKDVKLLKVCGMLIVRKGCKPSKLHAKNNL